MDGWTSGQARTLCFQHAQESGRSLFSRGSFVEERDEDYHREGWAIEGS
jgi:hypothetical protein